MQTFLNARIQLARALAGGALDAHPADVGLIATAVLSACSAICWPGKGIDRRRFIELLVSRSEAEFHTSWVSVPALLNDRVISVEETPYTGGQGDRIFRGDEVDLVLPEAIRRFPCVPEPRLRAYSYAALIYERLRCGYAHQYWHHEAISHVPPSRGALRVSYIGRIVGSGLRRMACFQLEYLLGLAEHHVPSLPESSLASPAPWWIDGG